MHLHIGIKTLQQCCNMSCPMHGAAGVFTYGTAFMSGHAPGMWRKATAQGPIASAVFCQETQKSKDKLGTYVSSALAALFVVPAYMA